MKKKSIEKIDGYFDLVIQALNRLDKESVAQLIDYLLATHQKGGTVYIFGNGGSGATASHFAGDFIKGVSYGLTKRFKVVCLNDNIPVLMALANDVSYDDIFVEQIKQILQKKDLVVGISGSGNSENVVKALRYAKRQQAATVALCGFDGGKIKKIADLAVHVQANNMEAVEDVHLIIVHCVKNIIKEYLVK